MTLFKIRSSSDTILVPTWLHFPSRNPPKWHQKSILKGINFLIDFNMDLLSISDRFWLPSWAILGRLGGVLGHLGPSWPPLGGLLGRLGSLLGPLGGQDPPEARGIRVFGASWGHLGLIFKTFLDGCWGEFSILFLSELQRRRHVVKPQNYYFCSTGEALEGLRGQYF